MTNEEAFDRAPDPTILRINAGEMIAHGAVLEAVRRLAREATLKYEQWELAGPPDGISRNFTLRLSGADGLASRRARKILDLRRNPDGSWRDNPTVMSPLGRNIELYISPDKSPKQLRTEQGGRKLLKAFKAVHPNKSFHLDKRAGVVSVDWSPVAKVEPKIEVNQSTVHWIPGTIERANIDKEQVLGAFNAESGNTAGLQWQI